MTKQAGNEQGQRQEEDEGTVELVRVKQNDGEDGVHYRPMKGDVRLENVNFFYEPGKPVLHDLTLYAKPGQKIAFVGATGAGKTTITNLINHFYDISDGMILYDGIDIHHIQKTSLSRSLGIVLQDIVLFTGTVMENIRYGKIECYR